jgi:hypothetical protein
MNRDEGENMTAGMRDYLAVLSAYGRTKLRHDSEHALRTAWPHRSTTRGRTVVAANIAMLRNLRAL